MIEINTGELKSDFINYYGGDRGSVRVFVCRACFYILGTGLFDGEGISIPLSIGTYAAVRTNETDVFTLKFSDSTEKYECSSQLLLNYGDRGFVRDIFAAAAFSKGNIKGADILFASDCEEFRRYATVVLCSFSIINSGKVVPNFYSIYRRDNCPFYINTAFECELYGRKNTALYKNANGLFEYIPFNLYGYKVIIALGNFKTDKINERINRLFESSDALSVKYMKNEKERIDIFKKIIADGDNILSYTNIFKNSALDFSKMLSKEGKELWAMYETAEKTQMCALIIHAFEYGGICAVVEDKNVDKFMRTFSAEYEKKAGLKPALYITNTDDSGVEI